MNYNFISQLVSNGYEGEQILPLLIKNYPHLAKKIKNLLVGGWGTNEILQVLQKDPQASKLSLKNAKPSTPEEIAALKVYEGKRSPDKSRDQQALEQLQRFTKKAIQTGIGIGGTALGAYALNRALPKGAQVLQGELLPAISQIEGQAAKQLPAPGQASMQPPYNPNGPGQVPLPYTNPTAQGMQRKQVSPIKPQAPIPQQTQQTQQTPIVSQETSQIHPLPPALHTMTQGLLEKGTSLEDVSDIIKKFNPKIVKEYEKATNTPIRSAIEEFSKSLPPKEQTQPMGTGIQEAQQPIQGKVSESIPILEEQKNEPELRAEQSTAQFNNKEEEKTKEAKKGSTVALPNGDIGEITNIRQGIATVNANGKEYRRKLDELIESPLPEKELADLYNDLVQGIKIETGQEVSRAVNYVGFSPEKKSLVVNYASPGADTYVFSDLNENRIKQLMELQQLRRTSNENYVGAWEEGTKSVFGSKMHDLVKELEKERGGKGKAHEFTYKTLYDALEPGKVASHQKFKEKEKAESAEKKAFKQAEKEKTKKKKEPESKILEKRFNKIAEKLTDLKNKPDSKNVKIQSERIENLERLEKEYSEAWNELRDQITHEKEMGDINEDIRKEKRKAKKPRSD